MVKVLVAGANGFIGGPAAQALSRGGHQVFGLTRSKETAKALQANEITPIIGDSANPAQWIERVHDVDVVIDAAGGNDIAKICTTLYEAFEGAAKKFRPHGPPLTYIYTSGSWVHGHDTNRSTIYTDSSPLGKGIPLTSWRIPHERRVLSTKTSSIQGVVVRPALLYGRSGSLVGDFLFNGASQGNVTWYGAPGGRTGTVHADDLADLFVRIVDRASILGGLAFIGANQESESWDYILNEMVKIVGASGFKYLPVENPFHEALATSQNFRSTLARDLLGWVPKKRGLGDGLAEYYAAWQATRQ